MPRQLYCRGMCKKLSRSGGQQRNYIKTKFPSNLNCGQKMVVKRAPGGDLPNYFIRWKQAIVMQHMLVILCIINSVIVRNFPSKFAHMHLRDIHYQWLESKCCKNDGFRYIEALICDNACRGPYGTGVWFAACTNHHSAGTSQAWGGGPRQPGRHLLAQTKYDACEKSPFCR